MPELIIRKLLALYESKQEYKALEKVLMKLDVSEHPRLKDELIVVCQVHCLIGALLHLMSTQESAGCREILNTLLSLLRKASAAEADKDDIFMLGRVDSVRKHEIEKSQAYIGYKLLW